MRVVSEAGTIELGTVEAAPTIGITDYSRRVTDDYGVTTIVKRGFSRRMSVRLAVPFDDVDRIQRELAALRATSATWVADDALASLAVRGLYKDFEVDHAVPPLSFCTLSVEGLAEDDSFVDAGGDPAPAGQASTLQLLAPIAVTDAMLLSSSVAEQDAPAWSAAATYGAAVRVIHAHRIWESLAAGNIGNDPTAAAGKWLDVGPTSRWAMFDQALGSVTSGGASIEVVLRPATPVTGLAILDTNAASVRVQASGYDRTQAVTDGAGSTLFLDLDAADDAIITVTLFAAGATPTTRTWDDGAAWNDGASWRDTIVGGDGTVSVGTLLVGQLHALGVTEAAPTSGITDYSRKETDQFGEVTIVPRAWAKRMAARALIRTDAVDAVFGRIAAVRALPSLWLADAAVDSLTIYGFFKDFSIEIGESVSKLSLSIEGLSTAGKVEPISGGTSGPVDWADLTDKTGMKPTNNADKTSDNTSKDTAAVGGKPAVRVLSDIEAAQAAIGAIDSETIPAINRAVADAGVRIEAARKEAQDAVAAASKSASDAVADANTRITASRTILDHAVADLAAEVTRARGADEELQQRIDAISASGGYDDTQVRALIQTVDTARADDKRAIAARVDSVVTDYVDRDTKANARITTTLQTLTSADMALGSRIDSVTAEYRGLNGTTNARIDSSVATLADADRVLGQRIDALVVEGNGYDDSYLRGEITRVEAAAITREGVITSRVDGLQASFTSSAGNLLTGTEFALPTLDGWTATALLPGSQMLRNASDNYWYPGGIEDVLNILQGAPYGNASFYCEVSSAPFAVRPGQWLQFYVFASSHRSRNWVTLFYYDGAGNIVGYAGENMAPRVDNGGRDIGGWDQNGQKAVQVPATAVYARLILRKYDTLAGNNDSVAWFWHPYVGEAREGQTAWNPYVVGNGRAALIAANARIDQTALSAADANKAAADLKTSVTTQFNGVNQTLGTYGQQITGLSTAQQGFVTRLDSISASFSNARALTPNADFRAKGDSWSGPGFVFDGASATSIAGSHYDLVSGVTIKIPDTGRGLRLHCTFDVLNTACQIYFGLQMFNAAGVHIGNVYADASTGQILDVGTYQIDQLFKGVFPELAVPQYRAGGRFIPTVDMVQIAFLANYNNTPGAAVRVRSLWAEDVGSVELANARIDQVATSVANANQAVADLTTSVNTRFAGVNTTLGTYDQRISTLSTAQQGFAGRATALEATATTGTSVAKNDQFAYWPDGQRNPVGWIDWVAEGAYTIERVASSNTGSPYAVRTTNNAGVMSGFFQVVPVSAGLWVIEVTARREAGSLSGAGITLSGSWNLDFLTDPDINGQVRDSRDGETRTWMKVVAIDDRTTVNLHAMQGWSGFGRGIASHYIIWSKVALRPAGPGDIAGIKNAADITSVTARVRASEDTLADLPNRYAAASRASTLEAQVNRTIASPLNSYIDAVNGRIDSVNGSTVATVNARIEDRASAIANAAAGAVAQTVAQLRSEYNGTVGTLEQQAGAIASIDGRTSVYWRVTGTTGDGQTMVQLSKQDGSPGLFYVNANMLVDGDLLVGGTVTTGKVAPNAITSMVAIAGMAGGGVTPDTYGESARVSFTSTGGTVKVDAQADGIRASGSGNMRVQLIAYYNGSELALSREVPFPTSTTAVPVCFFQISGFPAGTLVQFFLRFIVTASNTNWSWSGASIAVTEFKR